jgi:serine phosphatase RsbU (regulator of sigma subunit)/anti-sigma regulatory factor (Ser/Thr protein kinase)/anti-anti-sigma regulatory factor
VTDAEQPHPGHGENPASNPDTNIGLAEHVRAVFDQMPVPMVSVAGPDHVITAGNAAWRDLAGRAGVVGRSVREVFPEVEGQRLFEMCDQVFATGEAVHARRWRVQLDVEGSAVPQELYLDHDFVPYLSADGEVAGIHMTVLDVTRQVTELRRADWETRASRQRFDEALDVISALQDALLPAGLPVLPRVDVAAAYLLADADTSAGGDWYDAIPTRSGRVALVVGDVVGHGVAASAVMGQLRAVLSSSLREDVDPDRALAFLEQHAETVPQARAATLAVAVLDPATGQLTYCTAGHPPPLVVPDDGDPGFLPPSGAGPLGARIPFETMQHRLAPGDLVMLYSDGLMERPGRTPAQRTLEVAEVAANACRRRGFPTGAPASAAERVSNQALELLTRETGHTDDVTILAAQYAPALLDALAFDLPAVPSSIPAARHDLEEWLHHLRLGHADIAALQHAVGELTTNVVEHAYGRSDDPGGTLRLRATLNDDGTMTITVADDGRWVDPTTHAGRGLGLGMARSLVDELSLTASDHGTTVSVTHRVRRDRRVRHPGGAMTYPPAPADDLDISVDGSTVHVRGVVDMDGAARLAHTLDRVGRGGTTGVRVDLSGVTLLGSAGVRTLLDAVMARPTGGEPWVELTAPPGSVAQHVLELTRLPYRSAG